MDNTQLYNWIDGMIKTIDECQTMERAKGNPIKGVSFYCLSEIKGNLVGFKKVLEMEETNG